MVAPLVILAYILDKTKFTQKFWIMRKTISYRLLNRKVSLTISILATGIIFLIMGVLILYLAITGNLQMGANSGDWIRKINGWVMEKFAQPSPKASLVLDLKQDSTEPEVVVSAKPVINLSSKGKDVTFEFAINTHSVDLTNFAPLGNVKLVSGTKILTPDSWEENDGSTHHRSGRLTFKNVEKLSPIGS